MKYLLLITFIYILFPCRQSFSQETFPPLKDSKVSQTLEELWKDFDPGKEPLDTEMLKEWEEDGVVMKVLRYRIGIFKGKKAMMAAIYGYPKGAINLPGLVQIHGGGQYADYRAVLTKEISCPIIFLSPSNDFHGHINDLQKAVKEIKSKEWRVTCSPHHNHQDTHEYMVTGLLWLDQYLKGTFNFPETPKVSLDLKTKNKIPLFTVIPDTSKPFLYVDIYYTQQGQMDGKNDNMENTINRFWYYARANHKGNSWEAELPLLSTDKPLWVYANVVYPLDKPVTGAGYYYEIYTANKFNLSSLMQMVSPEQLKEAGVQATLKPSLVIETFEGDWRKEWFTYKPDDWACQTHKLHDDKWKAPKNAKLAFEVCSARRNKIVVGIDNYATEIKLSGGNKWQRIVLSAKDFQNALGKTLPAWTGIKELRLGAQETLNEKNDSENMKLELGAKWIGEKPKFRNLGWLSN